MVPGLCSCHEDYVSVCVHTHVWVHIRAIFRRLYLVSYVFIYKWGGKTISAEVLWYTWQQNVNWRKKLCLYQKPRNGHYQSFFFGPFSHKVAIANHRSWEWLLPTRGLSTLESFWFVRTWVVWLASRGQRSRMLLNILQGAEKVPSWGNDPDPNVDNGEAETDSPEM